jgi:hypothetical protein
MNDDDPEEEITDTGDSQVIERPDGFYWLDDINGKEYGPFPTLLAAMQDMQSGEEDDYEEGLSLNEAESEIGITDWINPDTGEPAEETAPRFSDD